MKTMLLLVVGVCCGVLGALILLDNEPEPPAAAVGVPSVAASGASNAPGRAAGADDVLDAAGRQVVLESLQRRAETAPGEAFDQALALEEGGLRTSALLYVARGWARHAPREALARAAGLPEDIRALVESVIAEEWAFVDPAGFLAYAEATDAVDRVIAGLQVLIAMDPERVWVIVDRYSGPDDPSVEELYLSAVRAMAGRDPTGTIARFQTVVAGQQRDPILTGIAEAYANIDPDAALAWIMSVEPLSHDAASAVIKIIATEDTLRGYEVVRQASEAGLSVESLRWMLAEAAVEGRQDTASIATALVQRYDREFSDPLVSALLNSWVRQAPDDAMVWLTANQASIAPEAVTTMVSNLAFDDVRLAASLADRVPREFRFQWLEQTAFRYGQFDSGGAIDWISQYEARPDYDQLLNQVLGGATRGDPQFVADYIETSGGRFDSDLINSTAGRLAEQNPRSAAEWAAGLADEEQSAAAMEGVALGWVQTDSAAAQQWVLEQPRGQSRDRILDALMTVNFFSPSGLDYELLAGGYSSASRADRTIARYVEQATRFPVSSPYREAAILQAEQMIDLMTDPDLRREAVERLDSAR